MAYVKCILVHQHRSVLRREECNLLPCAIRCTRELRIRQHIMSIVILLFLYISHSSFRRDVDTLLLFTYYVNRFYRNLSKILSILRKRLILLGFACFFHVHLPQHHNLIHDLKLHAPVTIQSQVIFFSGYCKLPKLLLCSNPKLHLQYHFSKNDCKRPIHAVSKPDLFAGQRERSPKLHLILCT